MRCCKSFLDVISRRKSWDVRSLHQTELSRSLSVLEIIGIGIGSCAGLGIFVMSAHVAKQEAGPSVVLSVLVASLAALLSGLCHIELATRIPRSGTGYTFCYVTFGELLAFVIGWSVALENVLNGAMAAKAVWQYVEYMYNYSSNSNSTETPINSEGHVLVASPDVFPCCIVIAVTFLTLTSVKRYAIINFILVSMSGLVVMSFICVGFFHVDARNWNSSPGFFAHGLGGVLSGAALIMSTFTSIDNLASCAEESRTPSKSLPTAFRFLLSSVFSVLFLTASALTLATPWQQLSDNAALARAYEIREIFAANYVIGIGAVVGLLPAVVGSFLHPVRILFSMSEDDLLPKCFSRIAFDGTPVCSHLIVGVFISLCALLLEFSTILEMSSIATILQFVASPIILLFIRYQPVSVGICRECSSSDLASICEDGYESKDKLSLKEMSEEFAQLAHDEHKIFKSDDDLYASIGVTSLFPKATPSDSMTEKDGQSLTSSYRLRNSGSNRYSWHSSKTFVNTFQNHNQDLDETKFSEKDCLRNGCVQNLNGKNSVYGLTENSVVPDLNRENIYAQIAEKNRTQSGNLIYKSRFRCSSGSGSFITLSPRKRRSADEYTWKLTRYLLLVYILSSTCFSSTCHAWLNLSFRTWWAASLICISLVLMIGSALGIARQPQNSAPLYFKSPYVPFVPLLSMPINMVLLASLPAICWGRFAIWLIPGLLIYAFYSHRHSMHRKDDEQEVALFDISEIPATNNK